VRPPAPILARVRAPLGLGLAALAVGGCGGPAAEAPEPPGGVRIRLVEQAGVLHAPPAPPAVPLLREDFERVPPDWRLATTASPLGADAATVRAVAGAEGGRRFLTLAGEQGLFYRIVPVEPGTPLAFMGTLRARGLEPAAQPFFGASFWLAELARSGPPEELFAEGTRFETVHMLASAAGREGWQTSRTAFRAGATTRALLVGCNLSLDVPLRGAGELDFDALELARIAESELFEFQAAGEVALALRGTTPPPAGDWRARRRVDAMFAAEQRPAILCLPGERLAFELEVPRGAPVFRCGLAPWPAGASAGGAARFVLRIDGRELLAVPLDARCPRAETAWRDAEVGLAAHAGRRVRLELGVEGGLPGLVGAPEVAAPPAGRGGWNVLLVSIDTLRADRVGAYGARSGATPRLDALARGALLFEDASANAPYTLPAHASLFSGQFPSVHGVEDEGRPLAPARSPVLARLLAQRGYATRAFTAAGFLTADFGFHAGFDAFSIRDPLRHPGSRFFRELERIHPEQGRAGDEPGREGVLRWLRAHAREPFFLFLHTYAVHDYDPPPGRLACAAEGCRAAIGDITPFTLRKLNRAPFPGTPEERAHLGHLYDAALAHVDEELGVLLDELAALGLAERTLVVVTSDHGEELFERGFLQHGKSLHEELLAIPLIVRVPGRAPARVAAPAMQVDVAPTVLAALGLPRDARMQGRDLLAPTGPPRPVWAEVNDRRARLASYREGPWKLVHGPTDAPVVFPSAREWTLYDLARDEGERADAAAREPERLAHLQQRLREFQAALAAEREALGPVVESAVDETTRRLLDALGYGGAEE
jgi:arylsulfatase A-like enzyme